MRNRIFIKGSWLEKQMIKARKEISGWPSWLRKLDREEDLFEEQSNQKGVTHYDN